jgi:nitrite reductase/ring-hydroxylating ferredoxin subunit
VSVTVCRLDDVPEGGSAGFTIEGLAGPLDLIVLRRAGTVLCYENACPHLGTPLDWAPGQFLTDDGAYVVCATHGALFRPEDGECIQGPCVGAKLPPVPAVVRDGQVVAFP